MGVRQHEPSLSGGLGDAFITLLGTASTRTLGWRWIDPGAALLAATVLVAVGTILFRDVARLPASER